MESFVAVASLVLELVGGGQNDTQLGTNVSENTMVLLRVDTAHSSNGNQES